MSREDYEKLKKDEKDSTITEIQITTDGVKDFGYGQPYYMLNTDTLLNGKRRGAVMGMNPHDTRAGYTVIEAEVPKAEMTDYTIALRAMTQGKGSFTYTVTRYDEVPGNIAQKIIAEAAQAE